MIFGHWTRYFTYTVAKFILITLKVFNFNFYFVAQAVHYLLRNVFFKLAKVILTVVYFINLTIHFIWIKILTRHFTHYVQILTPNNLFKSLRT